MFLNPTYRDASVIDTGLGSENFSPRTVITKQSGNTEQDVDSYHYLIIQNDLIYIWTSHRNLWPGAQDGDNWYSIRKLHQSTLSNKYLVIT